MDMALRPHSSLSVLLSSVHLRTLPLFPPSCSIHYTLTRSLGLLAPSATSQSHATRTAFLHSLAAAGLDFQSMPQSFRPYPEPGSDRKGQFLITRFLYESISNGGFHFMPLVLHILIPIYGVYRLLKQQGYWTSTADYAVEAILIPLLQGVATGGFLGTTFLRYATPEGRRIATKRADASATFDEDKDQYKLEVYLWSFIYLGFATVAWQHFPSSDGPGITAFKRFARRINVGVDLGW